MKKQLLLLPLFLLLFSCKDNSKSAGQFNDRIVELSNRCVGKQSVLQDAIDARDEAKSNAALADLEKCAKLAADSVRMLESPGDAPEDKDFRDAAIAYLENLDALAKTDYAEYCKLNMTPDSLFDETMVKRHQELADKINVKDSTADAAFNEAQKKFARKYNMTIQ